MTLTVHKQLYTWIIQFLNKLTSFNILNFRWISCTIVDKIIHCLATSQFHNTLLIILMSIFFCLTGKWCQIWHTEPLFMVLSINRVLDLVRLTFAAMLQNLSSHKTLLLFFCWFPLGTGWKPSDNHTVSTFVLCWRVLSFWCLNHFLICFTRNTVGSVTNLLNKLQMPFDITRWGGLNILCALVKGAIILISI